MEKPRDISEILPKPQYSFREVLTQEALQHANPEARRLRRIGILEAVLGVGGFIGSALTLKFAPHGVDIIGVFSTIPSLASAAHAPGILFEAKGVRKPKDAVDRSNQFRRLRKFGTEYRFEFPKSVLDSKRKSTEIYNSK